jgi:FkbM family methyltransferase
MQPNKLIRKLDEAVELFHKKKISKIAEQPAKFMASKMLEWIATLINHPIRVNTNVFWGENMKVVFPELISMNIFKYGYYEEGLTRIFLENLKPNMVLLDVGSHFGYYSLLGAFLTGEHGKIYAFEPTISSFNILRENTLNKYNITINNLGVSDTAKTICFYDYGVKYSAFNSMYDPRMIQKIRPKKYYIDCVSIDSYIKKENIVPDFIKIDAESSEYYIIKGMDRTIRDFKPIITLEVGDEGIQGIPKYREIIDKLMNDYDYKAYECRNGKIVKHKAVYETYAYNNILFHPEEII